MLLPRPRVQRRHPAHTLAGRAPSRRNGWEPQFPGGGGCSSPGPRAPRPVRSGTPASRGASGHTAAHPPAAPGPWRGAIPCRNCLSPTFCARRNPRSSISCAETTFPRSVRALGGSPSPPSRPGDTPRRCPAALETVTTVRRERGAGGGGRGCARRLEDARPAPAGARLVGWGWGGVSVLQVGKSGREAPLSKDYIPRSTRALAAGVDPGRGGMLTGSEEGRSSALAWLRGSVASVSMGYERDGRDG